MANTASDLLGNDKEAQRVPPESPLEVRLKSLWQQVLFISQIDSVTDSFKDLGGDSLSLASLEVAMNDQLALSRLVTVTELNTNMSIRAMADHIKLINITNEHLFGRSSNFFSPPLPKEVNIPPQIVVSDVLSEDNGYKNLSSPHCNKS